MRTSTDIFHHFESDGMEVPGRVIHSSRVSQPLAPSPRVQSCPVSRNFFPTFHRESSSVFHHPLYISLYRNYGQGFNVGILHRLLRRYFSEIYTMINLSLKYIYPSSASCAVILPHPCTALPCTLQQCSANQHCNVPSVSESAVHGHIFSIRFIKHL